MDDDEEEEEEQVDEEELEESVVSNTEEDDEVTGVVPLAATPHGRKVRFNSGSNETRSVTPAADTPPARANLSNQSFAALKTSFAFLATPQRSAAGTPRARTPGSLRAEPTPVALRRLGDRVRGEMERLYADSEEEEVTGGQPTMLRF